MAANAVAVGRVGRPRARAHHRSGRAGRASAGPVKCHWWPICGASEKKRHAMSIFLAPRHAMTHDLSVADTNNTETRSEPYWIIEDDGTCYQMMVTVTAADGSQREALPTMQEVLAAKCRHNKPC